MSKITIDLTKKQIHCALDALDLNIQENVSLLEQRKQKGLPADAEEEQILGELIETAEILANSLPLNKTDIIQTVQRWLEEQATYLLTEDRDYELAADVLEELKDLSQAEGDEKWKIASAKCQEWVGDIPHEVLLRDEEDGPLILAGADKGADPNA